MAITSYIKEIGRGKEGARSLSEAQAHDLMGQVLDGRVTDLEIGAFALAMRIKGESVHELVGFLNAAHERCIPIRTPHPTIVLPSYNGARKLPNLTPLLALLLAQEGAQVLVHGPMLDAGRVSTAEIFHDLGLPFARNADEIDNAWARREPVFIATADLCPSLARLLEVRRTVGLRNSGHTIAKLLRPVIAGTALRVVNHTHPEYSTMLSEFIAHTHADAVLMRGTEGEPVADPRRAPKLDVFIDGRLRADLSRAAHERCGDDGRLHPVGCQRREAGTGTADATGRLPDACARGDPSDRTAGAVRMSSPGRLKSELTAVRSTELA